MSEVFVCVAVVNCPRRVLALLSSARIFQNECLLSVLMDWMLTKGRCAWGRMYNVLRDLLLRHRLCHSLAHLVGGGECLRGRRRERHMDVPSSSSASTTDRSRPPPTKNRTRVFLPMQGRTDVNIVIESTCSVSHHVITIVYC